LGFQTEPSYREEILSREGAKSATERAEKKICCFFAFNFASFATSRVVWRLLRSHADVGLPP
jgi:hypothetical protein